jgi:hypothetical protein
LSGFVVEALTVKRLYKALCAFVVFVLVLVGLETKAHAYAWMIRHDYTACAQCHADPSGGSLLTPYGRAQSELLLRTYYGKEKADDRDPGTLGDFMFGAFALPDPLLLQTDTRALFLKTFVDGPGGDPRLLHMQSDLIGQATIKGRFRMNASVGYLYGAGGGQGAWLIGGAGSDPKDPNKHHLVSRHHWLGLDLGEDKQWLLRAGRMNLPFGIRGIEHTQFLRSSTRTDTNASQQHGLALAYGAGKIRAEVMAILGNFQLAPDTYRDRGYAGYLEYAASQKFAVGVNSMLTHAQTDLKTQVPTFRQAHGAFARYAPVRKLVISAEADALVLNPKKQGIFMGMSTYLTLDFEPTTGVHIMATGELQNTQFTRKELDIGVWGGAAWFFAPHVDVRADVIWRKINGGDGAATIAAQLHFFL